MTNDLNNLFRPTKAHIRPISEMIARAFQVDPGIIYYFPDKHERKKKSPYIFLEMVRRGLLYGEVYATSPNLEAVAIWLPSENMHMNVGRDIRTGALSTFLRLGRKKTSELRLFHHYLRSGHKRRAPFKHWYLLGLAVEPIYQGKGYASILLKAMFNRIDREDLPCYLETQKEKNVSVYQHYGFEIVDISVIPGTNISNWSMLRNKGHIN